MASENKTNESLVGKTVHVRFYSSITSHIVVNGRRQKVVEDQTGIVLKDTPKTYVVELPSGMAWTVRKKELISIEVTD